MAYTQNDYAIGGETEEERRRREEEERQRAAQGGGLDLAGIANRYVDQRLGQAEQRLSDIGQLYNDPGAALENRLGMTPEQAANTEVQSTQVKTYGDGSQEEIVKKQIPAPGPVAPEQVAPQPVAQPAPQAQPAPAAPVNPAAPQAQQTQDPAEIERRAAALRAMATQSQAAPQAQPQAAPEPQPQPQAQAAPAPVAPTQLPQPGPAVQVAGPAQMPPAATPTGQPQVAAPQAAPSLAQAGAQAQAAMMSPEERQQQAIIAAHNETDPAKRRQMFAQILGGDTTEGNKALANKYIAEDYIKQRNVKEAERKIAEATPTELARYMKEQKKEGSYVKAILLSRLGLTDLARREQELISPELKMDTATVGADKFTIVRNPQGGIETAFDINGNKASQEQLAKISAAAMPTKSFLLPQSAGGLMQKTITGPDGKQQVITGQVFTDPQTRETYFQAGNTRYDTTGLSTPAQNVQNVYSASGAKQQGSQDAQTGTNFVGGQGGGAVADPAAAERAKGDIAGSTREIQRLQSAPLIRGETRKSRQNSINTIQAELSAAQQRLAAASGVPGGAAGTGGLPQTGGAGGMLPGENFVQYQERIKRQGAEAQAATEANIALGKEERSKFLDYEEKEIVPKAEVAGSISSTRKSQLKGPDGILANPEIVGMMSGQGGTASEVGNIIRDLVTGEKTDDELSRRVASLGLTPRQKEVLYNQVALNRQIAPKTLKENAGAGSVSDAEQKANRDAAINIAKVPLYTAVTMLSKDQFDKDQSVARQAFRQSNPGLTTVRAFNEAWGKEKSKLDSEYNQIYAARAQYIKKYYNDGQNPGAIVDAYKHYPVPEFNRQTGAWDYGTEYARKAARPKISSFER